MEQGGFVHVDDFRRLSRHIRYGFLLSWIVTGILVGYFLTWLVGFNEARYERSWNGLRQTCDILQDEMGRIDLEGTRDQTDPVLGPFRYIHGTQVGSQACWAGSLVNWAGRPCGEADVRGFDVATASGDVRTFACPEFKNHVSLLIDEFRKAIGAHFTHDDISIPAFSSRLSVIDFILLAPFFLLGIVFWTQVNLQHARSFLLALFASGRGSLESLGTVISEIPLFRPNSGGVLVHLMAWVSLAPVAAMLALLGSDLWDLSLSEAVFTPRSDQPIWTWITSFNSGQYATAIIAREVILMAATLLLLVGGIRNTVVLLGIRSISCFGVLRAALERHVEERIPEIGWELTIPTPISVTRKRVTLQLDPSRRLAFHRMKHWRIHYDFTIENGCEPVRLIVQTSVPKLSAVHWEFSMPIDILVAQFRSGLAGYVTLIDAEFREQILAAADGLGLAAQPETPAKK